MSEAEDGLTELRAANDHLRLLVEGERIEWCRRSPQLKRDITIFTEKLTPQQLDRLNQIERELIDMAYEANEETKQKTILKGQ
jgi:hypothetical protein